MVSRGGGGVREFTIRIPVAALIGGMEAENNQIKPWERIYHGIDRASESNANEFAWSMRTMNCFACDGRQIADVETGWRERSMMCCAAELGGAGAYVLPLDLHLVCVLHLVGFRSTIASRPQRNTEFHRHA